MSLNVSLEEVPFAILEMVKARILAQRQKRESQPPRRSVQPRPQFRRFGADSKTWRRPQPAAVESSYEQSVGHFWLQIEEVSYTPVEILGIYSPGQGYIDFIVPSFTPFGGLQSNQTFFCGDGSSHITFNSGINPQSISYPSGSLPAAGSTAEVLVYFEKNTFSNTVVLPAGNGNAIVYYQHFASYASITASLTSFGIHPSGDYALGDRSKTTLNGLVEDYQVTQKCFVVNNKNIREISIPTSGALNAVFPAPFLTSKTFVTTVSNSYTGQPMSITNSYHDVEINTVNFIDTDAGFGRTFQYDRIGGWGTTPQVFQGYMQNIQTAAQWQSAIGDLVMSIPSDLQWIVQDQSNGMYEPDTWLPIANIRSGQAGEYAAFNAGTTYKYGQWKNDDEVPEYEEYEAPDDYSWYRYDPASYDQLPDQSLVMAAGRPVVNSGRIYFFPVADWGDPDYCRAVCKALGFSDSDLQP